MNESDLPNCGQCGRPFHERACGPTHAVIAADPTQYHPIPNDEEGTHPVKHLSLEMRPNDLGTIRAKLSAIEANMRFKAEQIDFLSGLLLENADVLKVAREIIDDAVVALVRYRPEWSEQEIHEGNISEQIARDFFKKWEQTGGLNVKK